MHIVSGFFQPREWAIPRQFGEMPKEVFPPKDEWISFEEYITPKLETELTDDGCIYNKIEQKNVWCED